MITNNTDLAMPIYRQSIGIQIIDQSKEEIQLKLNIYQIIVQSVYKTRFQVISVQLLNIEEEEGCWFTFHLFSSGECLLLLMGAKSFKIIHVRCASLAVVVGEEIMLRR